MGISRCRFDPIRSQDSLLQAVLNPSAQMQRLISALSSQQNLPMAPPAELPHENATITPSYINSPSAAANNSFDLSNFTYQPQADTSFFADNPFLTLNHGDEYNQNWNTLLGDTNQLQKQYRDVKEVSADVDTMQASLESFIQKLGIYRDQIRI